MKKFGKVLIILVLVIGAGFGLFYSSNATSKETRTAFELEGYVVIAGIDAESEKVYFDADTQYGISSANLITFNDIQETQYSVSEDTFFHFDGDYVSTLVDGVFMDLSETGNDYVTYYHTDPGMIVENGAKVSISTDTDKYSFDSILWKLNDDRYILLGGNISAVFGKEDTRNCGNYVELHYLDRGVVQIITEDNVWQTVSSTVYLETEGGIQLYPITEQLLNTANGRESFMNSLVVDADDNMHMRNAQEKNVNNIIPHFSVITKDGKDGDSGDIGADGKKGQDGAWGVDAGTTSSSKTEIPSLYIDEWHLSSTSMWGSVKIVDTSSTLVGDSFKEGETVYVVETGTSTKIPVVPVLPKQYDKQDNAFNQMNDEGVQYFKIDPEYQLKPDTEYNLVIRGSYSMGDYDTQSREGTNTDSTMQRDFIYRTFYTDSLGVFASKYGATVNTISVQLTKQDYSIAQKATVFLLTEAQLKDFTEATAIAEAKQSSGKYLLASYTYNDEDEGAITNIAEFGVVNSGQTLTANTKYIAKVLVTYQDSQNLTTVEKLSSQEVAITTLKTTPVITGLPTVASNRVNKCFEIYSAPVSDPDKAIIAYYYDVYDNEPVDDQNSLIKTIRVTPESFQATDYTVLDIDDTNIKFNHSYYVAERVEYNDNEKVVNLIKNSENNIVSSPSFTMSGSQLPSVSFRWLTDKAGNNIGQHYDRIQGWIVITKNGADIKVDAANPITVSMAAEGIFSKQMPYTNADVVDNGNEILIYLDENYLYNDTIYRLTVEASVDVNEDGETSTQVYSSRIIGNIVVQTPKIPRLKAVWIPTGSTTLRVSRTLTLEAVDPTDDVEYLSNTLSSMTVDFYSGAYGSGFKVSSVTFKDNIDDPYESDLKEALFTTGYTFSENTFNQQSSSLTSAAYSFVITSCYDYTYDKALPGNAGNISGYVNEITIDNNDSSPIGTVQTPPNLPEYGKEDTCVTVVALTKKQAVTKYGLEFSENLTDDTIVGYTLQSNYDNYAKLARSVTYYGFEANLFRSLYEEGINPQSKDSYSLFKVKLNVDTSTNVIPSLVVLFGTDPTDASIAGNTRHNDLDVFQIKNQNIIYAGNDVCNGTNLTSGMGRGYIYCFSYTVGYADSETGPEKNTYPQDHGQYNDWNAAHDLKPALVLRSQYMFAPKTMPTFQAYPWDMPSDKQGVMQLRYRYVDPDGLIKYDPDGVEGSRFMMNGTPYSTLQVGTSACSLFNDSTCPWEVVELTNLAAAMDKDGNNILTIGMVGNPYNIDYLTGAYTYDIEAADQEIIVYQTPWKTYYANTFDATKVTFTFDASEKALATNYINCYLSLNKDGGTTNSKTDLVGVLLHFTAKKDKTTSKFDLFCEFEDGGSDQLTCKIPLSKFANYLSYDLTYTADLIYDTGRIGWKYVEEDKDTYVALQRTAGKEFSSYLTKSVSSTSVIESTQAINSYFNLTKSSYVNEGDPQIHMLYVGAFSNSSRTRFTYIYSNRGLVYEDNTNIGLLAKILGTVNISNKNISNKTPSDSGGKIIVKSIVPTASAPTVSPKMSTANVGGFYINGADQIKVENDGFRYVYINIDKVVDKYGTTEYVMTQKYKVREVSEGKYYVDGFTLTGLSTSTEFIMMFDCYTDGSGDETVSIIDENSISGAALQRTFSTNSTVSISNVNMKYTNANYAKKAFDLSYNLSQTTDIVIEYSIYHYVDGDLVLYLSEEQMIARDIIDAVDNPSYSYLMSQKFRINQTDNPFVPGETYMMQIFVYTKEDHKLVSIEEAGQMEFSIPVSQSPISNIKMTPKYSMDTDLNKYYGFEFEVTAMSDPGYIVVGPDNGTYCIRVFKVENSGYTLVTDTTGIEVFYKSGKTEIATTMDAIYRSYFNSTESTPTYVIRGLDSSAQYKVVAYASVDHNFDGKNDYIDDESSYSGYQNKDIKTVLTENYDEFNSDETLRSYYVVSELTKETPDETGLVIDYVVSKLNPFNNSMVQLQYFDSAGVDKVGRIVISIIHESGSPAISSRDGSIEGADLESQFAYNEAQGTYTLSIPTTKFAATASGTYTVVVDHYVTSGSTERLVYTYSGKLVKD